MKKTFAIIFALILILPTIMAYITEVAVQTNPNELVSINVVDSRTDDKLFYAFERADSTGMYKKSISTGVKEIDVLIVSKDVNNVIIGKEDFKSHEAGEPISVNFIIPVVNESEQSINETEASEENQTTLIELTDAETEGSSSISGFSIASLASGTKDFFSKNLYYIMGVAIIGGVAIFFIMRKKSSIKPASQKEEVKVKKLSDWNEERKQTATQEYYKSQDMVELENKIKDAQKELNKLKNQDKIREVERKLQQDQLELEKLKTGEI